MIKFRFTVILSLLMTSWSWSVPVTENPHANPVASLDLLKDNKQVQQGLKALNDNLPLIAIDHFSTAESKLKDQPKELSLIQLLQAEAFIRANQTEKGLILLAQLPPSDMAYYWQAVGYLQQGKYVNSLDALHQISAQNEELQPYVLQIQARIGKLLNDSSLVIESLKKLSQSEDTSLASLAQFLYIDTLIDLKNTHEADLAIQELEQSPKTQGKLRPYLSLMKLRNKIEAHDFTTAHQIDQSVRQQYAQDNTIIQLCEILLAKLELEEAKSQKHSELSISSENGDEINEDSGTAEDRLANFISSHPDSPYLQEALSTLTQYECFQDPQIYEKLLQWSKSKEKNRQPLAIYTLGNLYLKKNEEGNAYKLAQEGLKLYPSHPHIKSLAINTINSLFKSSNWADIENLIKLYPSKDASIVFQQARIAFQKKEYDQAAQLFAEAKESGNSSIEKASLFNQNISALWANNPTLIQSLPLKAESPEAKNQLLYEQLHYAAKRMQPGVIKQLQDFIQQEGANPFRTLARLDLAEVALHSSPPELQVAKKVLQELSTSSLQGIDLQRYLTLQVLMPEALQLWPEAIAACRKALEQNPNGANADLLTLKLGELIYRNGDFNDALLVLQPFSTQFPESPYAQTALFLAGKAAQQCKTATSLEKALAIFNQLSDSSSAFSHTSQLEAAAILLEMGQSIEAIKRLDDLLKLKLSFYERLTALSLQADAWIQDANEDKDKLQKAAQLCTQILNSPKIGLAWKFKALTQRAQCYERMNNLQEALNDYAQILSHTPSNDGPNRRRDWYWFYNAGFSSLRLMELQQDWNAALALAEKLAQTNGPRAREASTYARRIRLEHFIWADSTPSNESPAN